MDSGSREETEEQEGLRLSRTVKMNRMSREEERHKIPGQRDKQG